MFLTMGLFLIPSREAHAMEFPPVVHAEAMELEWQLANGAPPVEYWYSVAVCESSLDGRTPRWNDRGQWAGGLGIYTAKSAKPKWFRAGAGTWERAGGEEFAPSPDRATPLQQIVVANRIARFGYTHRYTLPAGANGAPMEFTYRFRPVGYKGWGCVEKNWHRLNPARWRRSP